MDSEIIYTRTLKENLSEFSQWRLTVSEFREVQYLNIREYFMDFEGEWQPTKKGVSIPLELEFTRNLFNGLKDLVSEGEQQNE